MAPRKKTAYKQLAATLERSTIIVPTKTIACFQDAPLEIIWQIFSYSEPADLLHLSRTIKTFRSYLLSRASARAWKQSFAMLKEANGVPLCPGYLSEPQYANLLFSKLCHGCLTPCENIMWHLRSRFCDRCCKSLATTAFLIPTQATKIILSHQRQEVFPSEYKNGYCYLVTDLEGFSKRFRELQYPQQQRQLIRDWSKFTRAVKKHAMMCQAWMQEMARVQAQKDQELRTVRLRAIIERLRDEGWQEELKDLGIPENGELGVDSHWPFMPWRSLTLLDGVRESKTLTEEDWTEMGPSVIDFMETHRQARIERLERENNTSAFAVVQNALAKHRRNLTANTNQIVPHTVDVCLMPKIQELIKTYKGPSNSHTLSLKVAGLIPGICADWEKGRQTELCHWIQAQLGSSNKISPFTLAAACIIRCVQCNLALTYPTVLAHKCLHASRHLRTAGEDRAISELPNLEQAVLNHFECNQWSIDVLDMTKWAGNIGSVIKTACGSNWKKVTCEEMDDVDIRLTCLLCQEEGRMMVMRWRTAIEHGINSDHQLSDSKKIWDVVTDEDQLSKVKELEIVSQRLALIEDEESLHWTCGHCPFQEHSILEFTQKATVIEHLRYHHKVCNVVEGKDILRDPDAPLRVTGAVLLISEDINSRRLEKWERTWLKEGRAAYADLDI